MRVPEFPFVRRAEFDRIWRENAELRNALKRANEELRKHRILVGGILSGQVDVIGALDRVRAGVGGKRDA